MPAKPQTHAAAMRRANKAEAKRLRAMSRKILRDTNREIRIQESVVKTVEKNLEKLRAALPHRIAKISRDWRRESEKIERRLAILEGRGI